MTNREPWLVFLKEKKKEYGMEESKCSNVDTDAIVVVGKHSIAAT
jgi:hypothetical protein